MALHQIESEITKAIKAVKDAVLISKAKVQHATCIKEAEADCASTLAEAENHHSTALREAESWGASQAHSIQQSHAKDIQCLEAEATEEKGDQPSWGPWNNSYPIPSCARECSNICPAKNFPRSIPLQQEPAPQTPPASATIAPGPLP